MKKVMFWIALTALIVPIIARGLWFYRGVPAQPKIKTPDYQSLAAALIPLQTPEEEKNIKQIHGVVLLDYAHSNQYQLPEIQSLREAVEKRGGSMETAADTSSLAYKLKYASTYIVISPSTAFTAEDARIMQAFVERGGRLIVFTDATRGTVYSDFFTGSITNYSDANAVNPLLAPFEITINNDYLYNLNENDGNFRNVFFEKFGKHELTFGLKQVALYGTHSLKTPTGVILLRGAKSTLSSIDDSNDPNEGGAALSADGNVLAFGDFTFLTSPYQNAADNSTLIANIADFALNGKRTLSLENFPFVFSQPSVQLYPSSEVTLSAEAIASISGLQKSLDTMNTSINLVDEAPREGDAVILGTFTPGGDLEGFLEPFDITLDEDEFITLPKLGKIGRYGNGILLFEKNKKGNTLTLLADTSEDLVALIDVAASGSLDGCVLQDNIGICSVGYGGSYSEGEDTGEATKEPTTTEGEATPTPVPQG